MLELLVVLVVVVDELDVDDDDVVLDVVLSLVVVVDVLVDVLLVVDVDDVVTELVDVVAWIRADQQRIVLDVFLCRQRGSLNPASHRESRLEPVTLAPRDEDLTP